MRNKKLVIITLFLVFQQSLFYSQLSALDFDKQSGYWSVGAQYGNTFQWSDVDSEVDGWGTSLTLAKNLYFSEFSFFTVDLRSRLYFGVSKGLDGRANVNIQNNEVLNGSIDYNYVEDPGYFFNNYKTSLLSLDLEPNFMINKYRANTGWFLNLYGGAGLGVYTSRVDLSDENGDYSQRFAQIDQNRAESKIKGDIRNLLDGQYESKADGFNDFALKAGFMPSAGLEIGYDINRFLTAYLGHRTVFSRKDNLDGYAFGDPDQDLLHFTHVGLQVNFTKDKPNKSYVQYNSSSSTVSTDAEYSTFNEDPDHGFPIVHITYPEIDWFNTSKDEMEVVAEMENIYSVLDISCMVNGKEVAFDYDKDKVRFYAYLQRGTNVLKVQVRNEKGEARDIKRVIYSPVENEENVVEEFEENKPLIELISPEESSFYAKEDVIKIQAYIENVEVKDDIKLTANGMELNTFKFDPDLGIISITVRLAKGTNKFMLTAYNELGKTEQEFRIYYGVDPETEIVVDEGEVEGEGDPGNDEGYPPIESNTKPYISILEPYSNPFYTKDDAVFFQAEAHGVSQKEDIVFMINGRQNYFYKFDRNNKVISDDIHLMELETSVVIKLKNEFGSAEKELKIIYGDAPVKNEPKAQKIIDQVDVTKPNQDCQSDFKVSFNTSVKKEDIKITMNEFELRNYRYVEEDRELKFSLYLDQGNNDVIISVSANGKNENARINLQCGEGSDNDVIVDNGENEVIDTSPASIQKLQPADQLVTEEQDVILRFKVKHVQSKRDILIFLNDEIIDDFEFDSYSGDVQSLLSLRPKENEILVRVSNEYGEDEQSLMYYYDEPFRTLPSVVINSPRNGYQTDEQSLIFRASVDYIKSIDKVRVLLNNKEFTDFNYNEEFGKIQAYIPLRLGNNSIEVIAENKLGSSSDKVDFQQRVEYVPAVQILGPKEGLEYRKSFAMLSGIVQNMDSKQGIGIQINRKPFLALGYDKETEMVSSRLLLEKGNNEIILSAKNEFGFDSDTITIFFKGAPEKPTINFIHPARDGEYTSDKSFQLEADVTEVIHSMNLELTVNGQRIDEVYFYKNENKVRAEFNLKKGRNDIQLIANNETGSTSAQTSVYLQ
jgi:hypothetical protein